MTHGKEAALAIRPGKEMLYLSRADILSLEISPSEINAAVEAAFIAKAEGRAYIKPKIAIARPDGAALLGKAAALADPAYGSIKWLVNTPGNANKGLPDFLPIILLNEGVTGMPVAVMEATWITEVRTGSMSAICARYMARPESRKIGFIACGTQARGNFETIRAVLPLSDVTAYSRNLATAEAFADWARQRGVTARAVRDPREAITGMDVVVSSTPHATLKQSFLDPAWVSPGTFVSMVDLGFSWHRSGMSVFTRVVADDVEQSSPGGTEKLNFDGPYSADISEIVARRKPGRESAEERNVLITSGIGLADTGPAAFIYERAIAKGVGRVLPL